MLSDRGRDSPFDLPIFPLALFETYYLTKHYVLKIKKITYVDSPRDSASKTNTISRHSFSSDVESGDMESEETKEKQPPTSRQADEHKTSTSPKLNKGKEKQHRKSFRSNDDEKENPLALTIQDLPYELLDIIFSYLDEMDLTAAKDVSKLWRLRAEEFGSKFHWGERTVADNLFRSVIDPCYQIMTVENMDKYDLHYEFFEDKLFIFYVDEIDHQLTIYIHVRDLKSRKRVEYYKCPVENSSFSGEYFFDISNNYITISEVCGLRSNLIVVDRHSDRIRKFSEKMLRLSHMDSFAKERCYLAPPFLLNSDQHIYLITPEHKKSISIKKYDHELNELFLDLTQFKQIYRSSFEWIKPFIFDRFMIFQMRSTNILILNTETGAVKILEESKNPECKVIKGEPYLAIQTTLSQHSDRVEIINLNNNKRYSKLFKNLFIDKIKFLENSLLILCRNPKLGTFSIFSLNLKLKSKKLIARSTIQNIKVNNFWFIADALVLDVSNMKAKMRHLDIYKKDSKRDKKSGYVSQGPIVCKKITADSTPSPFEFKKFPPFLYHHGVFIGQEKSRGYDFLNPIFLDFTYKFSGSPDSGEGKDEKEKESGTD